ncbi:unnamed protein product [Fraxinus pennsylvanica]|uniref:Uncharacterized protein n=1 Tax=Fraxinus pennsylvanica TaxID=56036 RepID=A0AAD1YM87_9LAMI|nr:unnamed protein product [Fraxinus pennsylvanica]
MNRGEVQYSAYTSAVAVLTGGGDWLIAVVVVYAVAMVAEQLGFTSCIQSCLEYLEAVPWVGEEEEEKVVSSVLRLQDDGIGVTPVLKRVSSDISKPPMDTLSHVLELVLKSKEERGRREKKPKNLQ